MPLPVDYTVVARMQRILDPQVKTMYHRCILFALVGVALGLAHNAWGQAPPSTEDIASIDPTVALLTTILKDGSLPAVLGALGLWIGRATQGGIPLALRIHPEDRQVIIDALKSDT